MRIQILIYAEHNITFITNIITVVPVTFHVRIHKTISPKNVIIVDISTSQGSLPIESS